MPEHKLQSKLKELINNHKIQNNKKFKLIIFTGLLGDFDTFEYAQNLHEFTKSKEYRDNLEILFFAIGSQKGKEKFCNFTGLPPHYLKVSSDNELHSKFKIFKGLDIGFGAWINMFLMLSGFSSPKTIKEVLRGYTGDKNGKEIFQDSHQINLFNFFKFSGVLFKNTFGNGYLRPFELATYRLINMIEIISNWNDYILNSDFLTQRGATFLLNPDDDLVYEYHAREILSYSKDMKEPLRFLIDYLNND